METAEPIAEALGRELIVAGFDVILTGSRSLDATVGQAAVEECERQGLDPRERVTTYPHGRSGSASGFGMVLEPLDKRYQEVRSFVVRECDALVALVGGKGTSDCIQKAEFAGKPVFPIAVAGGAAKAEWERLKQSGYDRDRAISLDFLADRSADPESLVQRLVMACGTSLGGGGEGARHSRRVFVVHGHDDGLKNELARFLERLEFDPVVLHEQSDQGRPLLEKLLSEVGDVGFAFVLLTPDDVARSVRSSGPELHRARQNVIFEHGLLVGLLGSPRVCAIVKGALEVPSDLNGLLFKMLDSNSALSSIALDLVKELKTAGYNVDANLLS